MLFLIIRCWDRSQLEYLGTNITSYLKIPVEKTLQMTRKSYLVILFIPVLDWASSVVKSEWWKLIWRKSDSRSSSQLHLEKCLTPTYTPPLSWPVQGEGMQRDLAYIHPLSSSITCAVAEAFMRFLFFLVPALCSLLTPLISYSLFCFLIFKHMSSCICTHMLTSVSHSHPYSVSDIHILFIIPPSALSPAVVPWTFKRPQELIFYSIINAW